MSEFVPQQWNPTLPTVRAAQTVIRTSLAEAVKNPQILNANNSQPLK